MAGSLISGQLLAPLGARVTMLIGLPLGIAAWLGLVFSSQLWILMTCRFLIGCTFALVKQPAVMYMVEVAHESLRGRLVGVLCVSREIGLLSSYMLGGLMLTWRQLSLVYACCTALPVIGVFLLPNSPRWLATRGQVSEARQSLVFFRGHNCDVEVELLEVVRQADAAGASSRTWQQLRLLIRPGTLRIFILMLIFFAFAPLSGSVVVNPYMMIILDTPGAPLHPSLGSIVCSIFKITGTVVHMLTIDYFGRLPILVVGFSFISICTAAYGYCYIFLEDHIIDGITWVPLISIIFLLFFSGMLFPVFDVLQGELLPNACRAVSMPILSLLNGLIVFPSIQLFPQLTEVLGMHILFAFFTVVNLVLAVLGLVSLQETRGLSLEAISDAVHHSLTSNTDASNSSTNTSQCNVPEQIVVKQANTVRLSSVIAS